MAQAESTAVLTTGEVRFSGMVKGVMEYLDDIDFFTSESYIKEGLNKVKQLAVDLTFMVKSGKKQDYIGGKLIEAAAWFTSQWKGANGDRSGYKVAPEIIERLQSVLAVMDIPIDTFQAQGPSATVSFGTLVQNAGSQAAQAAASAAAANSTPTSQAPSAAPATTVNATNVGTDAEKAAAREEEKKKESWIKRQTYGIPNWGLILSGSLLAVGLASGAGAGLLKRRGRNITAATPKPKALIASAAANPRKKGKKSRR